MDKINYSKPVTTIDEQIKLLKSRGLLISNIDKARLILRNTNYYRLSAYTLPFEKKDININERLHLFRTDASLDRVIRFYDYDSEIRSLLFSLICDIEVYFKSRIAYTLAVKYNNPFLLYDSNIFRITQEYSEVIKYLKAEIIRSKETFIHHFKNKYIESDSHKLPIWVATEIMSFGTLSKLYKAMNKEDQTVFSKELQVPVRVLISWLHTFSYLRNICAHNGRIINRDFAIRPEKNKNIAKWEELDNTRLFNAIVTLEYIIKKSNIDTDNSLKKLDKIYSKIDVFLQHEPWMHPSIGLTNNIKSQQFLNDSDVK